MSANRALRLLVLLLPLAAGTARGEALVLSWSSSVYQDAQEVPLAAPEGVACTASSFAVADTGKQRILLFAMKPGGVAAQTGEVKLSQVPVPVRLQADSKGNLLALDGKSHKIVRINPAGAFAGFVDLKGGPAAPAVVAFKLDAGDGLYALDAASGKLLVADAAGAVSRQVELPKGPLFTDLTVVGGTVFAVDGVGATVWSVEREGKAFAQVGASLKDRMSFPAYITSFQGKLLLVDQNGMGIVTLGLDGSYLGRQLALGWNDGFVYYPSQLCFNEGGDAFLADRGNNRVQLFTTK
ncbi:MAG: hypothetical protein HZB56_23200 [Deltaproteobacteria bacterium]|nr:hypothetical protein [Deltaproteobacteria bacterium]